MGTVIARISFYLRLFSTKESVTVYSLAFESESERCSVGTRFKGGYPRISRVMHTLRSP